MGATKIEWADAVWNPVSGCTKVSAGCANCYAERQVKRFGQRIHSFPAMEGCDIPFSCVVCHHDRLDQPLHWRRPRRVFVCSIGDLFHEDVSDDFRDQVFAVMALSPQHTFMVLTKRADIMLRYMKRLESLVPHLCDDDDRSLGGFRWESGDPFPPFPLRNVIGMVSVEHQTAADDRVSKLLQAPWAMRGVSCEPLLADVQLWALADGSWHDAEGATRYNALTGSAWWGNNGDHGLGGGPKLDLVICGGETGPKARPMNPAWPRSLRDQCQAAGVPFFFKQWGEWSHRIMILGRRQADVKTGDGTHHRMYRVGKKAAGRELDGREWNEFPCSR